MVCKEPFDWLIVVFDLPVTECGSVSALKLNIDLGVVYELPTERPYHFFPEASIRLLKMMIILEGMVPSGAVIIPHAFYSTALLRFLL